MEKECFVRKFRFNQSFHLIAIDDFLKALLNSGTVQTRLPFLVGGVEQVSFKQVNCNVLNLSFFDFLEELQIVHGETGSIKGACDEWVDGIQCGNKLRLALLWEDDENFEEVH